MRALDLTGVPFGKLTVVERALTGHSPRGVPWLCRCECGNIKVVRTDQLRNGKVRSCGCLTRRWTGCDPANRAGRGIDVTGVRFGRLVAVARKQSERKGGQWTCRCDCGQESVVAVGDLRGGRTVSCGCLRGWETPLRPEHVRLRQTQRAKERYRTDVRFALNKRARDLMRRSLKKRSSHKSGGWERIAGYSIDQLEAHLRATMPPGFCWADFLSGHLHIDHRKPLASFAFSSADDPGFKAAWALNNLQLLPGAINRAKWHRTDESEDTCAGPRAFGLC